jgi:very-short-patch-repair endonuclease
MSIPNYVPNFKLYDRPYEDEIPGGENPQPFGSTLTSVMKRLSWKFAPDRAIALESDEAMASVKEEYHEQIRTAIARATPLCESPIEKMLLPWLVSQEYRLFKYNPAVLLPGETQDYVPFTVAVIPQLPIGRYRVDFALAMSRGGPIRFVIVECDGAEFHDGVENVVRDVNRDVRLESNGRVLTVVRLSGQEINRSPARAANKAMEAVVDAWAVTNKVLDGKFTPPRPR